MTVLFCDLAGSTAIAAGLDPEEWRATLDAYHCAAAEAITHFGGHVAKYLGGGVTAFFGHPEASDNDAERAARAEVVLPARFIFHFTASSQLLPASRRSTCDFRAS
jgi:class 3 adenylate cyclase